MSYNAKNYVEQGGDVTVIGGELNVAAGGKITAAGTQANTIANLDHSRPYRDQRNRHIYVGGAGGGAWS